MINGCVKAIVFILFLQNYRARRTSINEICQVRTELCCARGYRTRVKASPETIIYGQSIVKYCFIL